MHGIWVFVNHSGNTKIFVRYEARLRSNSIECTMELIGGEHEVEQCGTRVPSD
jgi:hypothetical protein